MATPRAKLQAIRLTDAAADRIKYVMANAEQPIVGVRVGVKNGGCAGMAYTMEYAERIDAADEVVEDKGVRVLIDPKAVLFLIGTEMDYKTDKLSAQFVFNNPNQTSACGCGESVKLKPAAMPTAAAALLAFVLLAFVLLAFVRLAGFAVLGCLRRVAHPRNALPNQLLDRRDALALGGRNDGDCGTAASGAAGTADAMDVIVGMVRDVEIEDVTDRGNVEAARRHVGGDQQGDFVLAELIERRRARRLVHVAVQRDHGKAVAQKRAMQRRDLPLAVAEDDRVGQRFGRTDEAAQRVTLLVPLAAGLDEPLRGGGDRGGRTRNLDLHRVVQELLGDAPDLRRHGGGEEQRLAGERNELADALDVGDETHVEHAVGLVDHQQLDSGEQQPPTLEMVEQAAGRSDEDIDAAGEFRILIVE